MQLPLLPRWFRWTIVVTVSAVIVYFSVIQVPSSPSGAGPFWDKKLHFAAYGGLTIAYGYATADYRQHPVWRALGVLVAVLIFGLLIEVIQAIVPVRQFSLLDLVANGVGAVMASVWFLLEPKISYRKLGPDAIVP